MAIARRTVPNCDGAGISLIVEGEPTTSAVSDRLAVGIDLVQYQTGEGPCLDAIGLGQVVRVDILERDQRFSRFAPGALAMEINSVLSVPLSATDRVVGALNLYSRLPNALDAEAEEAAQPLAGYAGEIIATSAVYAYALEMMDGLVESLENQAIIAQPSASSPPPSSSRARSAGEASEMGFGERPLHADGGGVGHRGAAHGNLDGVTRPTAGG